MSEFFRRKEKKYLIDILQYKKIIKIIENKMYKDKHGESKICNIYFDTNDYELIRHSLEKPIYKDKVRLRSYNIPNLEDTVYLEIKRKCNGIVSKRRISAKLEQVYNYINKREFTQVKDQVMKEIDYYFKFYKLQKTTFISYYRVAYYDKENSDFRVTFDSEIIARNYDLFLEKGIYGDRILEEGKYIMEIKTLDSIPLWFTKVISELKVYPYSFSKYGEAYKKEKVV